VKVPVREVKPCKKKKKEERLFLLPADDRAFSVFGSFPEKRILK